MGFVVPDPRWEEPALLLPRLKPTGPVGIDLDHPFSKGISNLWLYRPGPSEIESEYGGSPPPDPLGFDRIGGNDTHGFLNSGANHLSLTAVGGYGQGADFDGSTSDHLQSFLVKDSVNNRLDVGSTGGYFAVCYIRDAGLRTALVGNASGTINPIYQYGCAIGFVSDTAYAWRSSNDGTDNTSIALQAGFNAIACLFDGTSVVLSVNGVSSTGTCGSTGYTSYDFGVGEAASGSERSRMDGVMFMAGKYLGVKSESELNAFTLNPYQFLIPA